MKYNVFDSVYTTRHMTYSQMINMHETNITSDHLKVVKRIMCYLKCTKGFVVCYHGGSFKDRNVYRCILRCDSHESKSIPIYIILTNKGTIFWYSKKHACVALSIVEFEFVISLIAV